MLPAVRRLGSIDEASRIDLRSPMERDCQRGFASRTGGGRRQTPKIAVHASRCECGVEKSVAAGGLRSGQRSCGCLGRELTRARKAQQRAARDLKVKPSAGAGAPQPDPVRCGDVWLLDAWQAEEMQRRGYTVREIVRGTWEAALR